MKLGVFLKKNLVVHPWLFFTPRSNFLIVATAFITTIVLVTLHYSRSPKPYVAISAVSEFLSYRVARPTIAAIPVVNSLLRSTNLKCQMPFTGLVEPQLGAIVRYRSDGQRVSVEVNAGDGLAAILQSPEQDDCRVMGSLRVILEPQFLQISGAVRALPIAGPADIGSEFGAPAMPRTSPSGGPETEQIRNIMWEGSVQAFTRDIASGALSPRADAEFTLPAGGRISSGDNLDPAQTGQNIAPWYGIAEITDRGFKVSATTTSLDLKLYRPGTSRGDEEPFA